MQRHSGEELKHSSEKVGYPSYRRCHSSQLLPSSNKTDVHNYTTDDGVLRDNRNYTSVLLKKNLLTSASADYITAGELSANPTVADLLDRINDITRRDILGGGAAQGYRSRELCLGQGRWRAS